MQMKAVNIAFLTQLVEYLLDGEPVFIIRAKDKLSLEAVEHYIHKAQEAQAGNVARSTAAVVKFRNWQVENQQKMKLPD